AVQLAHKIAGEPADGAERRSAGSRGPWAPFVIVAVAHDTDAIAFLESIVQQPFECAPGGMHFDRALKSSIVGELDVGVASAHMRNHDGVLALQRAEEFV